MQIGIPVAATGEVPTWNVCLYTAAKQCTLVGIDSYIPEEDEVVIAGYDIPLTLTFIPIITALYHLD